MSFLKNLPLMEALEEKSGDRQSHKVPVFVPVYVEIFHRMSENLNLLVALHVSGIHPQRS